MAETRIILVPNMTHVSTIDWYWESKRQGLSEAQVTGVI
uniref:Uncharacterized protein n=1 Tax=Anguilla anguilla TaxID=7936 RepID=A0A0E9VWL4_ANGAN